MLWSFSFQLLPDETVIDDSTRRGNPAIKPAYSVFLTNRRAIFRFDGFGSSLTQSFFYNEILEIQPSKRLFFTYLNVKTASREFLLNTSDAVYWAEKIMEMKGSFPEAENTKQASLRSPERKKRELLDMLTILRKNDLLNDRELEEKIDLLDTMKF